MRRNSLGVQSDLSQRGFNDQRSTLNAQRQIQIVKRSVLDIGRSAFFRLPAYPSQQIRRPVFRLTARRGVFLSTRKIDADFARAAPLPRS